MKEILLKSGPARDKYARGDFEFARFKFSETHMTVSIGPDCPPESEVVSQLWSHTVFELEDLAMSLRYVALGNLEKGIEVPSRDTLIGPSVSLTPVLSTQLGHPGIGVEGRTTFIYCHAVSFRRAQRDLVALQAMNDFRSERTVFEIDEVLAFAEEIYAMAKEIAPHHGL